MKPTRSKLLLAGLAATFATALSVAAATRPGAAVAVVGPPVDVARSPSPSSSSASASSSLSASASSSPSASASASRASSSLPAPPATLRATGLLVDGSTTATAPGIRPFAPQYPLWTDGASKRRWILLPPGARIDASRADAWQFPVGTKLWKEFSFGGRPVETRYMERTAAGWLFATYAWNEAGIDALLAPGAGAASVELAPGVRHAIPSQQDCTLCHGTDAPVLGFAALQLSLARDPLAPHAAPPPAGAIDLADLLVEHRLSGFDPRIGAAPRIDAATATERAARGYLHGNCGGCHRDGGAAASLGMVLLQSVEPGAAPATATAIDVASRFRPAGVAAARRLAPGDAARSTIVHRMGSRAPVAQMPPIGTRLVDHDAVALVARWIDELGTTSTPSSNATSTTRH